MTSYDKDGDGVFDVLSVVITRGGVEYYRATGIRTNKGDGFFYRRSFSSKGVVIMELLQDQDQGRSETIVLRNSRGGADELYFLEAGGLATLASSDTKAAFNSLESWAGGATDALMLGWSVNPRLAAGAASGLANRARDAATEFERLRARDIKNGKPAVERSASEKVPSSGR